MRYRVILPRSVQKELDRLPDEVVTRILARLGIIWPAAARPAQTLA